MLSCYITSLSGTIFEGDAAEVQIPGSEGYFGVLPGHEKFISSINFGELNIIDIDGNKQKFLVWKGVFQVVMDRVVVIVDFGLKAENINTLKAKNQIEHDNKRIKELEKSSTADPALIEHIESRIQWNKKLIEYIK